MIVQKSQDFTRKAPRPRVVEHVDLLLGFNDKNLILDHLRGLTVNALEKHCPPIPKTLKTKSEHLITPQRQVQSTKDESLPSEPVARLRDVRAKRQQLKSSDATNGSILKPQEHLSSNDDKEKISAHNNLLRALFDRAKTDEYGIAHTAACALVLEHDLAVHDIIGKRQAQRAASHMANLSQPSLTFS